MLIFLLHFLQEICIKIVLINLSNFTIEPAGICNLALKMVNTSSATLMWNPTKTNFTSYKASLSNSTFMSKFMIPGAVSNFSVTNLTAGGIYNFTLRRLQGNIEGAPAFIEIVAGLYSFLFFLLAGEW